MKTAVKRLFQERTCRSLGLRWLPLLLLFVSFVNLETAAYGEVWYVKTAGSDANAGTSWEEAFATIQAAIDAAQKRDEIWVREGTYALSDTIDVGKGVLLYGGFAGTETERGQREWRNRVTIVDGQNGVNHCFYVKMPSFHYANARIDGFTITGGNAEVTSASENGSGGGIYNKQSATTIVNCTFTQNKAYGRTRGGGAIFVDGLDAPTIINCAFYENQAIGDETHGGAIHIASSNPTIVNCVFAGNSAGLFGGALLINGNTPEITNCTFSGNAAVRGGAVYTANFADPIFRNSIFWGNTVNLGNPLDGPEIYDSADDPFVSYDSSLVSVNYCDVQDGGTTGQSYFNDGTGNVAQDPLFVNAGSGDLRIPFNSPCVDQGDNSALPTDGADLDEDGDKAEQVPIDIAGSRRMVDTVDMGAYEYKKVWYVDGEVALSGSGMSWSEAFETIQEAIDAAQAGHEIWVKAWDYLLVEPIVANKEVSLYGGFAGTEKVREARNWVAQKTTVDGQGTVNHCFLVNGNVAIDGFVVTGGNADGSDPDNKGGGISIGASGADVFNCVLAGNSAGLSGGAIYNLGSGTLANCLVYGNDATNGGGIASENGSLTIINGTVSENTATNGGGIWDTDASSTLTNTIVWGNAATNGAALFLSGTSAPTVNYSVIEGGTGETWFDGGTGNLDTDPLFVDGANDDFHLRVNSPCIDRGNNAVVPVEITTDFDGEPRMGDGDENFTVTVDMGVDEYTHIPVTWYVDGTVLSSGEGASWAGAFKTVEEALVNPILRNYDQIWVKEGTYSPAYLGAWSNGQGLPVHRFVLLFGGFPTGVAAPAWSDRDWQAHSTVIDAQASMQPNGRMRCLDISGAFNYSHQNPRYPVIDGFTLTGGYQWDGGGIYISNRAPTLSNCRITGNASPNYGGAICAFNALPGNMVSNCLISGNAAPQGGAIISVGDYHPTLINCTVTGNITTDASGTGTIHIRPMNLDRVAILNTIIWGNVVEPDIPAIFFYDSNGEGSFPDWPYWANFSYNDIEGAGGESWFNNGAWNNSPGVNGTGNVDTNPLFAVPGHWDDNGTSGDPSDDFWVNGDSRLLEMSPCIDVGDDGSVPGDMNDLDGDGDTTEPVSFDLDHTPRFIDTVNMGAYETTGAPPGDLNGDGSVDADDLALLAPDFGAGDCGAGTTCEGDLDGDGDQDGVDLAIFASEL